MSEWCVYVFVCLCVCWYVNNHNFQGGEPLVSSSGGRGYKNLLTYVLQLGTFVR